MDRSSIVDQSFITVNQLFNELSKEYEIDKLIIYFDNFIIAKFKNVNIEPLALGIKIDSEVIKVGYEKILKMFPNFRYLKVPQFLFNKVDEKERLLRKVIVDGKELSTMRNNTKYTYHKCSIMNVASDNSVLEKLQKERNEVKIKLSQEMDEAVEFSEDDFDIEF